MAIGFFNRRQGLQPLTGLIQQFKLKENKNGE
jgi:hypothetical protein